MSLILSLIAGAIAGGLIEYLLNLLLPEKPLIKHILAIIGFIFVFGILSVQLSLENQDNPSPTPPLSEIHPSTTPSPEILRPEALQTITSVEKSTPIRQSSLFNRTDIEEWSVNNGSLSNSGEGGNTRNQNDGYLNTNSPSDGITNYFIAPTSYHGDWRGFIYLQIDIWSSGGEYYAEGSGAQGDIYIANGNLTAYYNFGQRPSEKWETFTIPLTDNNHWVLGNGVTKLEDILINVTHFYIRAEYGQGVDQSGLDNVKLLQ